MKKIEKDCLQFVALLIFSDFIRTTDRRFTTKGFSTLVKLDGNAHIIEAWQVDKDRAYYYPHGFIDDPIEYELMPFKVEAYL